MNNLPALPCTITEIEDGIVHIHIRDTSEFRKEHLVQLYDAIEKMYGGKKAGILSTFEGLTSYQKGVARYASSERAQKLVLATAYIIAPLAMRILVRFFLNFHKQKIPRKIFISKEKALTWLKKMKDRKK